MRIDIVIPAYNEELVIEDAIRQTRDVLQSARHDVQIIVSDNGSEDRTAEIAKNAGAVVLSVSIRGKGAAVREATRTSTADYFGFIDADLSAEPGEFLQLIRAMEESGADIAVGSRLKEGSVVHRSYLRSLSSKIFNALRFAILGISVSDTQCGLKLMNAKGRTVLASGKEDGWFFDIEFLARAERIGLSVVEVPVAWEEFRVPARHSKLHVMRDGLAAVRAMFRIRHRLTQTTNK